MVKKETVENKVNLAGIWFAGQEQADGFYSPENNSAFIKMSLVIEGGKQ